jgi:hypothetical protein
MTRNSKVTGDTPGDMYRCTRRPEIVGKRKDAA